jgi:succinate dehydrogenase hydrophobic anchor subunit
MINLFESRYIKTFILLLFDYIQIHHTLGIEGIEADVVKFDEKGNKAAGTRVRKAMQVIKGLAQDVRVYVSNKNKQG